MAGLKNITLTKRDQSIPVWQLVKGDRNTSGIILNVSRYDAGVDLSTLGWCINIMNANGDSDIIPIVPNVGDTWLTYEYFDIDIILSKNYCDITAFSSRNAYLSLYGYAGAGKNTGQTISKAFNDSLRPVVNKGFYQFGMYFAIPVGARIMILGKKA